MTRRLLLIAFSLTAACSKSKDAPPAADKAAPAPSAATAAAKPAEAKPAAAPPKLPAVAGLFACKAKDPAAQMAKAPAGKDPWALPFTIAGCPSVPPVFGKATFGMDEAAAQKAVPGSKIEDHIGYLYLGHHPHRQQYTFVFDDNGKLKSFGWNIDEKQFADIKAAWGEPITYTSLIDKENAWFNPAAHVKVIAKADKIMRGDDDVPGYRVEVVPYIPMAEFVGKDGVVGKAIIGKTVKELADAYPDLIDIKSKEENHANLQKMGVDKNTMKEVDALGAAGDTVALNYPPTETADHQSLVQLDVDKQKIASYSVIVPFSKDPALRDELLATVAATLGAPVGAKQELDEWVYTFAAPQNQVVDMSFAILKDAWQLKVHPK